MPGEFDLIDRIRARAGARDDVVLGIGDDAALLVPPAGRQLVITADTLNAGVHFPDGTAAADVGWKALAVNLSDLAAMGAQPAWCTLSLSLPEADPRWLDAFLDGFLALAQRCGVALVGGDTTRGPLSVGVTALGHVAAGAALRRDGARDGDGIWVSGSLGDAAAALSLLVGGDTATVGKADAGGLRERLDRPEPRLALGAALGGVASACIDLSDGLLADLGHVCRASGVGARVDVDRLPLSDALRRAAPDPARRRVLQASGGDDFELCFTAAAGRRDAVLQAAAAAGTAVACIGEIVAGSGVQAHAGGLPWTPPRAGYEHFDS